MTTSIIWPIAAITYAVFWCWYVGFRQKITPREVEKTLQLLDVHDFGTGEQRDSLRHFLANDDGRDFVMVNLLHMKAPLGESRQKLEAYQKIFLGALLRKAGHPVMMARAAVGNLENVACDHADNWTAAGMVRYRSRRDFMEMLPATVGSPHHGLKLEALEKTFAFPASRWFMSGGPRLVVALSIALIAAIIQLAVGV
jgi:hypothetical protein